MILNQRLEDHTIDFSFLIDIRKEQFFFVPKEESQMFSGKDTNYIPNSNVSNINNETAQQPWTTNLPLGINTNWNATDYIGSNNFKIPYTLNLDFVDLTLTQVSTNNTIILDPRIHLFKVSNGVYRFVLPANFLNIKFIDPENDFDYTQKFGDFYVKLSPKKITANIVEITPRSQYITSELNDAQNTFRRKIYKLDASQFKNTPWSFETQNYQSGRLMGSNAEINGINGIYKTNKVIAENDFKGLVDTVDVVLSPDTVGYDSPLELIGVGDQIQITPRETAFEEVFVQINYIDDKIIEKQAYRYLMNDVLRDITTGIYEVYDENGVTVNTNGTFDGRVIQTYQIQQFGQYELRKKIKNS